MQRRPLTETEIYTTVKSFLDDCYMDVQFTNPFTGDSQVTYDQVVSLLTKIVVGICTVWWSINELMDYLKNKRTLGDLLNGNSI